MNDNNNNTREYIIRSYMLTTQNLDQAEANCRRRPFATPQAALKGIRAYFRIIDLNQQRIATRWRKCLPEVFRICLATLLKRPRSPNQRMTSVAGMLPKPSMNPQHRSRPFL